MENIDVPLENFENTNVADNNSLDPSAMKVSSCSREQLLEMLAIMEAELQARDVALATQQNEKLRHMLYEAKFGRSCLDDPYIALERDGAVLGEDLDEDMLMRAAHETKLVHLENLLAAQNSLVEKVRQQVQLYQTKYSGVCCELTDERKKREQETAHSEKKQTCLEVETKKLQEELAAERTSVKAYQDDLALMVSVVESLRADIANHKKVAFMLIKERKLLAECLLKDRQRLKELEEAALNEDRAVLDRAEERVLQMAQERLLLEDRLRQEESKQKAARMEADRYRQQVDFLQNQLQQQHIQMQVAGQVRQSSSPGSGVAAAESRSPMPSSLTGPATAHRISSPLTQSPAATTATTASPLNNISAPQFAVTGRVPLDNAPVIAQRALAPTYRSQASAVSPSAAQPVIPSRSSSVGGSPATTPTSLVGQSGSKMNFLPGQSAVLTTPSGQRISLHVSPSKPVAPALTAPSTMQASPIASLAGGQVPSPVQTPSNRLGNASTPTLSVIRPLQSTQVLPNNNQRFVPSTTLSPTTNTQPQGTPVAVSSSFNITIRPDGKGMSTFVGASTAPEPPARLGLGSATGIHSSSALSARPQSAMLSSSSSGSLVGSSVSASAFQLDSPTDSNRYLTIKKIGVAATANSVNN